MSSRLGVVAACVAVGLLMSGCEEQAGQAPAQQERASVNRTAAEVRLSPSQKVLFPCELYDGAERYRMDQDDEKGLKGIQGLATLARRWGQKPYDKLWEDDHWQEERVVFHDVSTGAEIWRLTRDAGSDSVPYHKGAWTANGARIVWRRSPGMWEASTPTHGPTVMNADGTCIRPVFRDYRLVRKIQCSRTDPNICYAMAQDKKLVAFNLDTGTTGNVLGDFPGCWHLKLSLDGKYLCGSYREGGRREDGKVWIISTDGRERHEVHVGYIHDSYYFHPRLPMIMYWRERQMGKEGFWQVSFDGRKKVNVKMRFDWNHGDFGGDGGVHTVGSRFRIDGESWTRDSKSLFFPDDKFNDDDPRYFEEPARYGGYATWMPKDEPWFYGTRTGPPPWLGELFMSATEAPPDSRANRFRICYTNMSRARTMDAPDGSPDGTKVLFNSDMFNIPQIYCVVVRKPEPPVALTAQWKDDKVWLSWHKAKHAKETAGFNVYRSGQSGTGYQQINRTLIAGTSFADADVTADTAYYYVVTSVEHSTLEGNFSAEAAVASSRSVLDRQPHRLFVEAESAGTHDSLWRAFDGNASGLYIIWQRKKDAPGKASIPVTIPRAGEYFVWVRLRSPLKSTLATMGNNVEVESPDWVWRRCGKARLEKGEQRIEVVTSAYQTALDCFYLATDEAFVPRGKNSMDAAAPEKPEGLRAAADGPFAARLEWQAPAAGDVHHYNLYVSREADFTCDRKTLTASPADSNYYDWQVDPKVKTFYRVTAVDRQGNESQPSGACELVPEKIEIVTVEKAFDPKLSFEVPIDGKYVCWLKIKKSRQSGGSIYTKLNIDGQNQRTWTVRYPDIHDLGPAEAWLTYGEFGVFELTAGAHTLNVDSKYPVSRVLITNDLSHLPAGYPLTRFGW